ncbi:chromate transporter [Paenibacillus caui]|uniref:chromate transporter n=1 Tax=Paenibacillus caui TaxID=2873927 RepID=UPI001CA811B7|nr:chromate transporter [Paenibacillus caui]
MIWLYLLLGFFLSNLFGYGGGPSTIPLMYREIVPHYHWLTNAEFNDMLALGNSLPGPIATKIAAYVGYSTLGWFGFALAIFATVAPSAIALILLLKVLSKYKQSLVVKGMTLLVQPVIAIMMLELVWQSARDSVQTIGYVQFIIIAAAAYWLMQHRKMHPALVIVIAFVYGGIFTYLNI